MGIIIFEEGYIMKDLFERFVQYVKFHPEVVLRASYSIVVVLLMVVGVMGSNLSYYKGMNSNLIKISKDLHESNKILVAKTKVLETNYYSVEEDYSIYEKGIAKDYDDKLDVIKRVDGVKKNVIFIKYLSKVKLEPKFVELIAGAFYDASLKHGMDSRELIATAWHESRFKPKSRSHVGAIGVMQIMPLWLKNDNFVFDNEIHTREDLTDPVKNIHAGAYIYNHYKEYWMNRGYKKDFNIRRLALLSYNRGHRRVSYLMRNGENPANGYFKVISKKYKKLINLEKSMI